MRLKSFLLLDCSPSIGLESSEGLPPPPFPENYFSVKDKEIRSFDLLDSSNRTFKDL